MDLEEIYGRRFDNFESRRNQIWKVLSKDFFQRLIPDGNEKILDLGCGYGEFINNISARRKYAVDLNPASRSRLEKDVQFFELPAQEIKATPVLQDIDVIFTSNFFEHLPSKESLSQVVEASFSILRPGGVLIAMGPNIRYLPGTYWDFIDHHIPLTDKSVSELLASSGFRIKKVIPKFLPYTMSNRRPPRSSFVRMYLLFPVAWKLLGKQFLVVAEKPMEVA